MKQINRIARNKLLSFIIYLPFNVGYTRTQGDDNMWGEHSWAQQAAWERSLVMEDRVDRVSLDSAWFITGQPGPSLDTCSSVFSIMSQLEGGGTAPLDNEHLRSVDTGVFMVRGHGYLLYPWYLGNYLLYSLSTETIFTRQQSFLVV